MSTLPWNGSPLAIVVDKGTHLNIRAARAGDNPAHVFECDQLESLFATLAGAKMPVLAANCVLYGTERNPETGRPLAIQAAERKPYKNKTTGAEGIFNYAYSPAQLDKLVPVSFAVVTKFMKAKGRNIPMPLFLVHETPYERSAAQSAVAFQRVTALKPVDAPVIVRRGK